MTRLTILSITTILVHSVHAQFEPPDPSGFQGLVVETYYVADMNDAADLDGGTGLAAGAVTYRVFVDLLPGYKLLTVGGYENHPLTISSTTGLWNNDDRGEAWGWDLPAQHLNKNTVAIDSWLTMGMASSLHWGILKEDDPDGSVVGGANNDGGSNGVPEGLLLNDAPAMGIPLTTADGLWTDEVPPAGVFVGTPPTMFESGGSNEYSNDNFAWAILGGIASPDTNNRILIGQFTTDGTLSFCLNLWVRIPDSLVCADPNCHEIMEFYSEIVPSDTLGGGFASQNKFTHPTLCFNSGELGVDCLGEPGGTALPGTTCDDGNPDTSNDVFSDDCICVGEDCEGVPGGAALPGAPCDDGNPETLDDVWQAGCICEGVVGISETDGGLPWLQVQPNPAKDLFWAIISPTRPGNARLELLDALGSVVLARELGVLTGSSRVEHDISGLATGLYHVRLVMDGQVHTTRIIKQ